MNYIQQYHKMPLTSIYLENKSEYFTSLQETRKQEDILIFRKFMFSQTEKYLLRKIKELTEEQTIKKQKGKDKGISFLF
jgi:hypothetical protein